jgi:hypothetical protein
LRVRIEGAIENDPATVVSLVGQGHLAGLPGSVSPTERAAGSGDATKRQWGSRGCKRSRRNPAGEKHGKTRSPSNAQLQVQTTADDHYSGVIM